MSTVFIDNPYNSQHFTTCCKVAICPDQQRCPECNQDVYPFFKGMSDKERAEAAGGYYNHNTAMARNSVTSQKARR